MPKGSDILLRLIKAAAFALALVVASAALAPDASAHGLVHHPSSTSGVEGVVPADGGVPTISAPTVRVVAFAASWKADAHSGDRCPAGSTGSCACCTGSLCCSVPCGGAMTLPDVPDLGFLRSSAPPLVATPLSAGTGTRPTEHPPRSLI